MEIKYKEYLESYAWKALKKVKLEDCPNCEACGNLATTVHHLSYERRGSEIEEDIVSLCENCHHECHFINGYQIKNDEDILRRRFEEIRNFNLLSKGNIFSFIYNEETNEREWYKFGKKLNKTCIGIYDDGINLYYARIIAFELDRDWEEEYYENERRKEEWGNGPENDGSYHPAYDGDLDSYFNYEPPDDYHDNYFHLSERYKSEIVCNICQGECMDTYVLYKYLDIQLSEIKILSHDYLIIKDRVYSFANYGVIEILGADSKTFEVIDYNFSKDKNFVYDRFGESLMKTDPVLETFEEILGADSKIEDFVYDRLGESLMKTDPVYYRFVESLIREESGAFEIIINHYSNDINKVYIQLGNNSKRGNSISETVEEIIDKFSKNKVYLYTRLVKNLVRDDPRTLEIINKYFTYDFKLEYMLSQIMEL